MSGFKYGVMLGIYVEFLGGLGGVKNVNIPLFCIEEWALEVRLRTIADIAGSSNWIFDIPVEPRSWGDIFSFPQSQQVCPLQERKLANTMA